MNESMQKMIKLSVGLVFAIITPMAITATFVEVSPSSLVGSNSSLKHQRNHLRTHSWLQYFKFYSLPMPSIVTMASRSSSPDKDSEFELDFQKVSNFSRRQFLKGPSTLGMANILLLSPKISLATDLTQTTSQHSQSEKSSTVIEIYNAGAATYDKLYSNSLVSRALDFPYLRRSLLTRARGSVLELGVGTGLNLPHYPPDTTGKLITSYDAVDISSNMLECARSRFEAAAAAASLSSDETETDSNDYLVSPSLLSLYNQQKVTLSIADASQLTSALYIQSKDSQSIDLKMPKKFDTIIDTFGLCVFENPIQVLTEARKLLLNDNNDGRLLLLEHQDSMVSKVLSPSRKANFGTTPVGGVASNADVASTCRYDDNVVELVEKAGFEILEKKDVAGGFLCLIVARPKAEFVSI